VIRLPAARSQAQGTLIAGASVAFGLSACGGSTVGRLSVVAGHVTIASPAVQRAGAPVAVGFFDAATASC
jgi:hypothetical protein